MDDGSLCKKVRNGKIHAWELYLNTYLSKEENQVIIDYLVDEFKKSNGIVSQLFEIAKSSRLESKGSFVIRERKVLKF